MFKRKPLLVVKKQQTETTEPSTDTQTYETQTYDTQTYDTQTETQTYDTQTEIQTDKFAKFKVKSVQNTLTVEQIKARLEGYTALKTIDEMKILKKLPLYRTWVKYIVKDTKQYRGGGMLIQSCYPEFIILKNMQNKVSWRVNLDDVIIFVKDPINKALTEAEKAKEKKIKDKLFEMYVNGQLRFEGHHKSKN